MAETVGLVSAERRARSVREIRPPRRIISKTIDRFTSRIALLSTFPPGSDAIRLIGKLIN
jgi:hypothetical protein